MFNATDFMRIVAGATRRAVVSVVTPLTTPALLLTIGSLPLPATDQCTG
jgi:hypothetical protein